MNTELFKYKSYCNYLSNRLNSFSNRSGKKKEFSKYIGCQSSFLSQVLSKKVHLSLEQGIKANSFFHHSDLESHFFMLLLQKERAGSLELKKYYESQLIDINNQQIKMVTHLSNFNEVPEKIQAKFYSSWKYQAIQTLLSINNLQTAEALSNYLSLSLEETYNILNFLTEHQLVIKKNDFFQIGPRNLHLTENSDFLKQHHINWRLKAMDSLGRSKSNFDLHYSAVITLSKDDVIELRKKLLEQLKSNLSFVQNSPEEVGYSLCIDFFNLNEF